MPTTLRLSLLVAVIGVLLIPGSVSAQKEQKEQKEQEAPPPAPRHPQPD
jgi:hypothetical protein